MKRPIAALASALILSTYCSAQSADMSPDQQAAELAKKLSNPIASLTSIPIQANFDQDIGKADEGEKYTINVQPVIPFELNEDWNLISRTVLPIIDQSDIPVKGESDSGIGDIVQSFFFSPKATTPSGWIWGAGPVLLLPTASEDAFGGSDDFGIGPTAVFLRQTSGWTYGMLLNHIWSIDGSTIGGEVNASFIQPFINYITSTQTTLVLNSESTVNWRTDKGAVPINAEVKQMIRLGNQLAQIGAGVRYWVDGPDNGAEGWGGRVSFTMLFPK